MKDVLEDAKENKERYEQTKDYGQLSYGNAANSNLKSKKVVRIPDTYEFSAGAGNNWDKKVAGQKSEYSGTKKKIFRIEGEIVISET